MVEASVGRTVGDIGEYFLYDLGQGIGLAATYLATGAITNAGWGNQSRNAALGSLGAAAVFFYLASSVVDNETTGDVLSTATLGALVSAFLWWNGVPEWDEIVDGDGGQETTPRYRKALAKSVRERKQRAFPSR